MYVCAAESHREQVAWKRKRRGVLHRVSSQVCDASSHTEERKIVCGSKENKEISFSHETYTREDKLKFSLGRGFLGFTTKESCYIQVSEDLMWAHINS